MNRVFQVMTVVSAFATTPAMAQYADPDQPDAGAAIGAAIVGGLLGAAVGAAVGGRHGHGPERAGLIDHKALGGKKGAQGHMGAGKPGGGMMHKHKPGT